MSRHHFTWTKPADIEGEPNEVAELSVQQVRGLANVVADITAGTFTQLRAAGVGDQTADEWADSKPGVAAADLVWAARVFVEAAKAL